MFSPCDPLPLHVSSTCSNVVEVLHSYHALLGIITTISIGQQSEIPISLISLIKTLLKGSPMDPSTQ